MVEVLGVRHHGPGSARSVGRALDLLEPDVVVIEGPPELDAVAALALDAAMAPPVAGLVYDVKEPRRASFYPMAVFSPEWVALRWALKHGAMVRYVDLPAANRLAEPDPDPAGSDSDPAGSEAADSDPAGSEAADSDGADSDTGEAHHADDGATREVDPWQTLTAEQLADPLGVLAQLAGYDDAERWWEDAIEQRSPGDNVLHRFALVREAMAELRRSLDNRAMPDPELNERREASMRKILRSVVRGAKGAEAPRSVAVVCGAFHAPALHPDDWPSASADNATLRGLAKTKVAATWAPWTSGRLAYASGYGAGVTAPGWYEHLFVTGADPSADDLVGAGRDEVVSRWMVRLARALRAEGHDASAASAVEATRLATTLAALRARPLAGLAEVGDAAQTVFGHGSNLPLATVAPAMLVGNSLGAVPPETPMVPLAQDLAATQRSLRLKVSAEAKTVIVDLRQPAQLARSVLFQRLLLLGIDWARAADAGRSTGTFKEAWTLEWVPEFTVAVIEASVFGTTVHSAAEAKVVDEAEAAPDLASLASLIEICLAAKLPLALDAVLSILSARTALQPDHLAVMGSVEPLARTRRYSDVRGVDTEVVHDVLVAMVARSAIGLASACASLDDDAATEMRTAVESVERGVSLVADNDLTARWHDALEGLSSTVHGAVLGRTTRILLDAGRIDVEEGGRRLGRALSLASDPGQGAAWLDGFLAGDVALLLLDAKLFALVDQWLSGLDKAGFDDLLPLIRRTFSRFEPAERRQIGNLVSRGGGLLDGDRDGSAVDVERARPTVAKVAQLLGLASFGSPAEVSP